MSNRRRSERYAIALPVWLKDARGGERTETVDVSAHGIAVLAGHERPLRQYVELELALDDPEAKISVTAVVARHAEVRTAGEKKHGLGLDFFLFDAQAKASWQQFIRGLPLRAAPPPPGKPRASLPPPPPPPDEDDTPTFIIKPRDLGRLWAFFRGEMARGVVRIETPVLKPVGHPAELLVVHPTSQAEWALEGEVVTATPNGRGGRPVLEIGLAELPADLRAAFRTFVSTGRGQVEEDISLELTDEDHDLSGPAGVRPDDDPEPERIESVVIDLDSLDPFEESLASGLIEAPNVFANPPEDTPSGLQAQAPDAEIEDEDPTQHAPSPIPPGFVPEPPAPPRRAPREEEDERPTSVFASFFDEARAADPSLISEGPEEDEAPSERVGFDSPEITDEAEVDLSVVSRALSVTGSRAADLDEPDAEPIPLTTRKAPRPPPLPPSARIPTDAEVRAAPVTGTRPAPRPDSVPRRAVPPLPPSARARRRPSDDPSVKVGPAAPSIPLVAGRKDSAEAELPVDFMAQNPPVPGPMFDFGDPSQRIVAPPRKATPPPPPPPDPVPAPRAATPVAVTPAGASRRPPERRGPPPARRNARKTTEEQERARHTALSTESADPNLARDIALARARVVRSPHSVTACYRLSTLLLQGTDDQGFDEAIRALEKVIALEPNHPGAHHKLAELHARRGDHAKAGEHLARARRLGYQVDPVLETIINAAKRE